MNIGKLSIFTGIASRLTFGAAVFGILLSSVCGVLGYRDFSRILKRQYNDTAYEIACTARDILNPDKFDGYLYMKKTDEEYEKTLEMLNILAKNSNSNFIYVVKVDFNSDCTLNYTYIYETDTCLTHPELEAYTLGYTETGLKKDYFNGVTDIMKNGAEKMVYYSDTVQTGYHVTAAVPVMDSYGTPAAMVCVEKPMNRLQEAAAAYIKTFFAGTAAVLIIFSVVYVTILHKTVITPILTTADEAQRFAVENTASDNLLSVLRHDEIGTLARALCKMEHDIENYTVNLASVTAERERVDTELAIASRIQMSMLPESFEKFSQCANVDIYALMCPAKEVGGDFYDFFMADDTHAAFVAADVSGKGVPAALFMAIGKTLIKDRTMSGKSIDKVFEEVNDLLCDSNNEGLFITAFEGVLDIESGEFIFVNAGHETPFIRRKNGVFEPYRIASDFVLAGIEGTRYSCGSIRLETGDMLFQYTDGVTEAADIYNVLYGEGRLTAALQRNSGLPPSELLPKIKSNIDAFVGEAPQFDDITMICFEYKGKSCKNNEAANILNSEGGQRNDRTEN